MEIKKITCPFCEKIMCEHPEQGDINFYPTHLASSKDFFPESINCVILTKYICLCGAVMSIPESKVYKGAGEKVKENNFPCDTCMYEHMIGCANSCKENYECSEVKKFRERNPFSLRGKPTIVRLAEEEGEEKEYSPKKED